MDAKAISETEDLGCLGFLNLHTCDQPNIQIQSHGLTRERAFQHHIERGYCYLF